ncbi:Pimeloyl-ACP methyl ester carboxylesterase [Seinonella peptonophila]|uniref:Pimeloyl-ACP methyl ester carboxylesterase n=1 Tax=Seinonella peptonophila TaxID=112248 RepID=A0A1M4SVE0_9BACL|nr:alpha/beta hydrolase [Seinonella peptonophila]SHE36175.1 Pimeloyl-ACP methyl ester carboxylesterase [Seinonella peptonophila]
MSVFHGLDVPLMILLLLIWISNGWISGRLIFISEFNQIRKYTAALSILSIILLLLIVFIILEAILGLGYLFENDKMPLIYTLLLLPLLGVIFFSVPKIKSIFHEMNNAPNDEISKNIRQFITSLPFVLPFQLGIYVTIMNLCFFLFPFGFLSFIDYATPYILLLFIFLVLWFRYRHRQRVILEQNHMKNSLWNRLWRTSISLVLAVVSLVVYLTMAVTATMSNGVSEESSKKNVKVHRGYVKIEGANLYYEVRGEGPPLLMIPGGGGDAGFYTYVANILADRYQVITYDRRGNSRSKWSGPHNFELSQQTRDAVAVLRATHHNSAYVFGNSGGAIFALEMAEKYPNMIKAVVVHEPPIVKVLPDQKKWLTLFSDIDESSNRLGAEFANTQFAFALGIPASAFTHIPEDFQGRNGKNIEILINNEMQPSIHYMPNIEKIKRNKVKVIMAAGELSLAKERFYARTAPILAQQLQAKLVIFPGHHLSYFDMPKKWAEALDKAIKGGSEVTLKLATICHICFFDDFIQYINSTYAQLIYLILENPKTTMGFLGFF